MAGTDTRSLIPARRCIGFGERESKCENVAGTPWTPLWCLECDEQRRAHITAQMENISAGFAARVKP